MKVIKYFEFIKEDLNENKYSDIKQDVSDMIEKSLKTSDKKTIQDFIEAYIKSPEDTQIEGLINDSDVYEFYLKYRNDIDEILSEIKFYDEKPSEMNVFGVYEYIIKATQKAILEIVVKLKSNTTETTE